jgi:hypothetical protein
MIVALGAWIEQFVFSRLADEESYDGKKAAAILQVDVMMMILRGSNEFIM